MITYTVKVDDDGNRSWYLNDKCHRLDGPAVEWADGSKYWYVDGKRHRLDGPAAECADGYKAWYVDGKLHREDGPAAEWADGSKEWWVDGVELTEAEFNKRTKAVSCAGKIVEVDGRKYRLVDA